MQVHLESVYNYNTRFFNLVLALFRHVEEKNPSIIVYQDEQEERLELIIYLVHQELDSLSSSSSQRSPRI